jgi:hypothetical protein
MDNYGTHKHEKVRRFLERHRRFKVHYIPTSSSWLNLVERWFAELSGKAIQRGSFASVPDLIQAILDFIAKWNAEPQAETSRRGIPLPLARLMLRRGHEQGRVQPLGEMPSCRQHSDHSRRNCDRRRDAPDSWKKLRHIWSCGETVKCGSKRLVRFK